MSPPYIWWAALTPLQRRQISCETSCPPATGRIGRDERERAQRGRVGESTSTWCEKGEKGGRERRIELYKQVERENGGADDVLEEEIRIRRREEKKGAREEIGLTGR